MNESEAVSKGIRVHVTSHYSAEHSQPKSLWFFLYTIKISNESTDTVQLISRHWIITNAENKVEEVQGPGVIGKQPVLAPGESFEYTSGCPLTTPFGMMKGTYQMVTADGDNFEVEIAPFALTEPYTVH
ncbi:MAG: Co2+/Mg2+ efflux protein ApaG [Acidobacteriota bacterium]|nr:Co2+/Mg2+ efflux protein ApaG [Vicinamibacterales bacterium]MEE2609937.1 Co2+/Mg2+ efflux protein ApaG [Acidobacteriota bacterium]MEE3138218.1 Co2+/Mg2+ efflux protein ApaG [Acidobacteriota bacterium]|tara:strand:+ start:80 stop:466 length:387 start_codon:yes stop_codon:yes gene_type:complete